MRLPRLSEVVIGVVTAAFFVVVYLAIYFVTVSYTMTENGPLEWSEGWDAVKEFLAGTL